MKTTTEKVSPRSLHIRMLLIGLLLALSVAALPGRAGADPADDAGVDVALMNQSRAEVGVDRLMPEAELQIVANRQAHRMAESGTIFHTEDLGGQFGSGWQGLAENVGYGPSVGWIHGAFMNSPHHAANIVNAAYNYVGVGVAYGDDGNAYVAVVFGAW